MKLSVIEEVTKETKTTGVSAFMELEIGKVYPNPNQPRKTFDEEYIKELAQSIKVNGLIQPIAVKKDESGKYMIISGECRYKAHLEAGLKTIKTHIMNIKNIDELSLIENIQRDDLTPFEIAKHINILWYGVNYTGGNYKLKKDLAAAIGKSDTYVSKALSLSHLDDAIIEEIETNNLDIGISVLDEISRSGDFDMQRLVFDEYNKGNIKRDDISKLKSKDISQWKKHKLLKSDIGHKIKDEPKLIEDEKEEILEEPMVCYGFGTQNKFGSFITPVDHDINTPFDFQYGGIEGVLKFNHLQQIAKIETSNDINYKITIEKISGKEYKDLEKIRTSFNEALESDCYEVEGDLYEPVNYKHREIKELIAENERLKKELGDIKCHDQ